VKRFLQFNKSKSQAAFRFALLCFRIESAHTTLKKRVAMAKKRTKADKLQRNVERLAKRDAACRERSAMNEERPEPAKRKATAA
jgi:hypothetical protein